MMVGDRRSEEVVDPKLPEMPSSKALKRVLLVALKCVDPDAQKRPKMGQVIHMLDADDLLFRDVCSIFHSPNNCSFKLENIVAERSIAFFACRKDELGENLQIPIAIIKKRMLPLQK